MISFMEKGAPQERLRKSENSCSQGSVFALPQVLLERICETAAGICFLLLRLLGTGLHEHDRQGTRQKASCVGPSLARWPARPAEHQPAAPVVV